MTTPRRERTYEIVTDRTVAPVRAVARLTCSRCGGHECVQVHQGADNPEFVAKLFVKRGWSAHAFHARSCVCPSCVNERPANDPDSELRKMKVVPMAEVRKNAAEVIAENREATPAEKAAIRRKLDEVFDDSAGMFLDGQSDQSIGTALNIPWSLVRRVREAAYGPIRSDPQLEKARSDLRSLSEEIVAVKVKVDKALSDVGVAFKRLGM